MIDNSKEEILRLSKLIEKQKKIIAMLYEEIKELEDENADIRDNVFYVCENCGYHNTID